MRHPKVPFPWLWPPQILDEDLSDLPNWDQLDNLDDPNPDAIGRHWPVEEPVPLVRTDDRWVRPGHWLLDPIDGRCWVPEGVARTHDNPKYNYYEIHRCSVAEVRAARQREKERMERLKRWRMWSAKDW